MNEQTSALLSLLSRCEPDDQELAKANLINEITRMPEYQELAHRKAFQEPFQQLFAPEKMRNASVSHLQKLTQVLPLLPDCLDNILYSLKNGECPQLTEKDRPDFTDAESVRKLSARLEKASGRNFTNISPAKFLCIFDASTVKSAKDIFGSLPYQCEDYAVALQQLLSNRKYCISEKEIQQLEEGYRTQLASVQKVIESSQFVGFKYKLLKGLVSVTFILIPFWVSHFTGNLSPSMTMLATAIVGIGDFLFWKKG